MRHIFVRHYRASLVSAFCFTFSSGLKAISFNTANFKHWVGARIQKYYVKEERNLLQHKGYQWGRAPIEDK